jgi:phosphatidylserine decarboxylase
MFHKEGYKSLLITAIFCIGVDVLVYFLIPQLWIVQIIWVLSIILFLLILQFFRNPKRTTAVSDDTIVAPVDGKVVVIEDVYEGEYLKEHRKQMSIFMSPINVHITRHPISGKVVYSKYHPGKYLVAWHPKSSELNERTTVVVENDTAGKVLYRQIAGAMAKRIVNYAEEGTEVIQASDSGFIKFGSRVDILLPKNAEVNVKLKEKVKGGLSVIAKL